MGTEGRVERSIRWRERLFGAASRVIPPGGPRWADGAPILLYHCVSSGNAPPVDPFAVSEDAFARQIAQLVERYSLVTVQELVGRLERGEAHGSAAVTFDDGFRCTLTRALPVLQAHGARATVFVDTGRLDGGGPALRSDDVLELDEAGMEIGSHSVTHRNLVDLDERALRHEVTESRVALEELLDREVVGFAHPFGRYDERVREVVREAGYSYACTCRQHRTNHGGDDPYQLTRVEINGTDGPRRFDAKLRGRYAPLYSAWYRMNPGTRGWVEGEA